MMHALYESSTGLDGQLTGLARPGPARPGLAGQLCKHFTCTINDCTAIIKGNLGSTNTDLMIRKVDQFVT